MNPEELSEVKSSAYPKLERVPGKQNWVDHAGGLPKYIERIAKHLHYEKGFSISAAIAIAVNTVKRWATAGSVTKTGKGAGHQVTAATRAKAAKAVAEWEAKKKSGSAKMAAAKAIKEAAAVEEVTELTIADETELLEAVAEAEDYTEQIVNDLVRYFGHPRKLAEQMVENSLADTAGVSMTPEERDNIRGRLATRLALLEGVALSLTGDERTRSLAVANAHQLLTPGQKAVKLNEVEAVEESEVRWLFAQLDPEVEGLQNAVDALSEAKLTTPERAALPEGEFVFPKERRYPIHDKEHARAALGMVAMHGTPDEIAKVRAAVASRYPSLSLKESDTTADYPNMMTPSGTGSVCKTCGHSMDKHNGKGKCAECHPDIYRAYEPQESAEVEEACDCWDGYCRVPGTKPCAPGSCKKCDKGREKDKLDEAMRGQRSKGTLPPENPEGKEEGPHDAISADAKINADADVERVKHLQARLDSLGFETKVDGDFGPKTQERVKEFQLHAGLIQDGIVGPKTTERLQQAPGPEDIDAVAAKPSLVPQVIHRSETVPEAIDPKDAEDAKKPEGDSSDEKKSKTVAVQEGLADGFGSEMDMGPTIMPDDLNLMNPVTPIQVAPRKDESSFSPPPKPKAIPQRKVPKAVLFKGLGVGDARSNADVREAQADLGRLGYNLSVDGRFGPETEQAVKRFQRKYGLKADGVVGPKTNRTIKGVKKHLEKIDEAILDQDLAADGPEWQEARDRLVELKRELAEAEKRGERAWPEAEDEIEEAVRGAARDVVAKLKRLDDGTFAPKGMGRVLVPGEKVELPKGTGVVTGNKVEILDGPRKGELVKLTPDAVDPDADYYSELDYQTLSDDDFEDAMRMAGGWLRPPDGYDYDGSYEELPEGNGWWFRFMKANDASKRSYAVLMTDGSVGSGKSIEDALKNTEYHEDDYDELDEADQSQYAGLVADVPEDGLVEVGGYVYKRVGPNKWTLEDGQETLETDETLAYRLSHDASLAMSDGAKELEGEQEEKKESPEEEKAETPEEEKAEKEEAEDEDESDLTDNIGPDAKAVKDLKQGQKMMLTNGAEYVYDRQADPSKPFHIIKPVGWTEDNELKAKPMHGELVPPKIGPEPSAASKALEAYKAAGGDDPVVMDALRAVEAADLDFDEAFAIAEAFSEDKHTRAAKGQPNGGQFISSGSKGEPVKRVQKEIGAKETGKWDDKLTAAVKEYQKKNGLLVDGIVGAQTWASFSGKKAEPGALPASVMKSLSKKTDRKESEPGLSTDAFEKKYAR